MLLGTLLRSLEFDTRQGKLVEAAVVKERWAAILVEIKQRILAVSDKFAPELTALTDDCQVRDRGARRARLRLRGATGADIDGSYSRRRWGAID